jgi:glycosyltransferase involved in cell wall biosynthesis
LSGLPVSLFQYRSWRERRREAKSKDVKEMHSVITAPLRTLLELTAFVKKVRPDAVILNNGGFPGGSSLYLVLAVLACLRINRRIMVIENFPGPTISQMRLAWARTTLSIFAVSIVAISKSLAEFLVREAQLAQERVKTIYFGVAEPSNPSRAPALCEPGSVSIVGSVEERKGHEVLLRAVALLRERYTKLKVIFVGHCDDSERVRLSSIANKLGIADRLEWKGFCGDIDVVFAGVEILVVPSIRQESFGRVAAEAMARGIPVIGSDCGGLPEVIGNGIGGIIVPANDPEELARSVDLMLSNHELRIRLGRGGVVRYNEMFSAANMAIKFATFLHTDRLLG